MKARFLVLTMVLGLMCLPVLADVLFDNGSVVEQDGGVRFNVDDDSIYDDFTLTSDSSSITLTQETPFHRSPVPFRDLADTYCVPPTNGTHKKIRKIFGSCILNNPKALTL